MYQLSKFVAFSAALGMMECMPRDVAMMAGLAGTLCVLTGFSLRELAKAAPAVSISYYAGNMRK